LLAYNCGVDIQQKASSGPADPKTSKLCVYTALFGGYEELNEQPVARQSNIPFICFTDDPELRSDTWQIRLVTPLFGMDPARSHRDFKLRPHVHLPEFDLSLYIDNAVVLSQPPEKVVEKFSPAKGFWLARHSFRESVLDEFLTVAKLSLDDQSRVFEQLNHYTLLWPELLSERQYWGGILLRDHRVAEVRAMSDTWYANVLRYSRRDQLSINLAFRQAGLTPGIMDVENNYRSWFHSWPHTPGRDRKKGTLDPAISFSPPVARVRQLERELAEAERRQKEMESSDAWLVGQRLTRAAASHPLLVRPLLRVLRLVPGKRAPR
jgi:TOD1/MUCI70, glycosyltransferase-like domain